MVIPEYVSSGHLPPADRVQSLIDEAYERFRTSDGGTNAQIYPALAAASRDLFGICVCETSGAIHAAGDAIVGFALMSVSKPFVFALVCQVLGAIDARARLGVNATGLPFNSLEAVQRSADGRTNPMVNSGAITATSLVPGDYGRGQVAGDPERPAASRGVSSPSTRGLRLGLRPTSATRPRRGSRSAAASTSTRPRRRPSSTRGSARSASARRDLAVMGATLADGGVNPLTRERVIDQEVCRYTLAVMTTAGPVRDLGRLALRRRPARQERDRGRDRHRLARQGRARHLRAATRRGRQQRQRATRRPLPLAAARPRSVRLRTGGLSVGRPGVDGSSGRARQASEGVATLAS